MVEFPSTFEDKDDIGNQLENGYFSVGEKIKNRISYLGHPHKRNRNLDNQLHIKDKSWKLVKSLKTRTVPWQPESIPENEIPESNEEQRLEFNSIDFNTSITEEKVTITVSDLKETYRT